MTSNDKVAEAKKRAQDQLRAQQRRTAVVWGVIAVVAVALFAALIFYIIRQQDVTTISGEGQLAPASATADGGFGVAANGTVGEGLGEAPVRLDVYFDFMCPYCSLFEQTQGPTLDALRAEGLVEVYYHPLGFLNRYSNGTEYSTRAASAAALIAEESPENFLAFVEGMFANQPAEGSDGLSEEQIQEIARAAGVPDDVVAKIPNLAYTDWVTTASDAAGKDGVVWTPAIKIDGELQDTQSDPNAVNWGAQGALEAAIREAAQD